MNRGKKLLLSNYFSIYCAFRLSDQSPPLHEITSTVKIIFIISVISWSGGIDLTSEITVNAAESLRNTCHDTFGLSFKFQGYQ